MSASGRKHSITAHGKLQVGADRIRPRGIGAGRQRMLLPPLCKGGEKTQQRIVGDVDPDVSPKQHNSGSCRTSDAPQGLRSAFQSPQPARSSPPSPPRGKASVFASAYCRARRPRCPAKQKRGKTIIPLATRGKTCYTDNMKSYTIGQGNPGTFCRTRTEGRRLFCRFFSAA